MGSLHCPLRYQQRLQLDLLVRTSRLRSNRPRGSLRPTAQKSWRVSRTDRAKIHRRMQAATAHFVQRLPKQTLTIGQPARDKPTWPWRSPEETRKQRRSFPKFRPLAKRISTITHSSRTACQMRDGTTRRETRSAIPAELGSRVRGDRCGCHRRKLWPRMFCRTDLQSVPPIIHFGREIRPTEISRLELADDFRTSHCCQGAIQAKSHVFGKKSDAAIGQREL